MASKTREIGCQGRTKYYTKPAAHISKPCFPEAKFCSGRTDHLCDHQLSSGSEPVVWLPILAASNQKESVMGATVRTSIAPLAGRVASRIHQN
ncbi:hypothetical protein MGG_17094 [Pyricularia oryzae 70-15]|uniref:Uncharacterized protein n=2 Tax=Pyricularia oryzae TaxID=318829 RepID=G4N8C5_PYRO7|nr:uncharacterized protein MGG_17094 [Pyricularia oryzae 70-15]EHA50172.1 hypothetical protein MGG_17094 [Pyricularia oryzae 70-15]ELQ40421.1 hypothetical protein OOU_Y34scaffold00437g7 [Pyricularia oryzae Y34]